MIKKLFIDKNNLIENIHEHFSIEVTKIGCVYKSIHKKNVSFGYQMDKVRPYINFCTNIIFIQ